MNAASPDTSDARAADRGRRELVLAAALETFARYGYRKTSMEDVARSAAISRPGLYLLFGSKQELFTAAVTQALDQSLTAATGVLTALLNAALLDAALAESPDTAQAAKSAAVTQTLISTSIGIKHEVTTREAFLERLATAIDLIVC